MMSSMAIWAMTPRKVTLPAVAWSSCRPFDLVVNFHDAAADQKQAADQQDQVADRNLVDFLVSVFGQPGSSIAGQAELGELEDRVLRLHHPRDAEQQGDPRPIAANRPIWRARFCCSTGRRLLTTEMKDDVVDAQDDFHRREGDQGDDVVQQARVFVHIGEATSYVV